MDDDYENNDELITDLMVSNNTKGDWITNYGDRFYDAIISNNPINYRDGIMDKKDLNGYYIKKDNIIHVNKNEKCWNNIRLNFYERNFFLVNNDY